jgi:hypothetical protein
MKLSGHGARAFVFAALAAILSACEGGGGTDSGVPSSMVAAAPKSQAAVTGTPVPEAPAVRITDQLGNPISGVAVTFSVAGGGGAVASVAATTDASGTASAGAWTLGPAPGDNAVTASHGSLPPVQFLATGQPRVPRTVAPVSAAAQMGVAGAAVAQAPAVRVLDQTGQVMHGVTVRFAVAAGGGWVGYTEIGTDTGGVASAVVWTLGAAEQNAVTATVEGLLPVQFSAIARPRVATTLTTVSSTSQTAIAGTAVAQAPTVRVHDQLGEPLPGVTVSFALAAGDSWIVNHSPVSDAQGLASAGTWTLGAAGQTRVSASVGNGVVNFEATALPRVPGSIAALSVTEQEGMARGAVQHPPSVRIEDQTGAPLGGVPVTFTVTAGGGSVIPHTVNTNASGVATAVRWTLGAAGQNTLQASAAGVPAVTFRATAQDPCLLSPDLPLGGNVGDSFSVTDCALPDGRRRDAYNVTLTSEPVILNLNSQVMSRIEVYNASNTLVAASAGALETSGNTAAVRMFAAPGRYRVYVQTVAKADGLSLYELTAAVFNSQHSACRLYSVGSYIAIRTTLDAEDCTFQASPADNYYVMVHPGRSLVVRMQSFALDPYLHLFDESGSRVGQDDNSGGGTTALLTYRNNGDVVQRYRVIAASTSETAAGEYVLTVAF